MMFIKKAYGEKKISSIVNAFGTHDVISEYLIMRNLFYLRLIKVDENLKYVLTLKIDKFLNNMEKFYKPLVLDFFSNN